MGGKSSYLQRQNNLMKAAFEAGEDTGMQEMWDFVQLVLRDPKVMGGKNVFGRKRLERFYAALMATADKHRLALTDHKEADYAQEKFDAELRGPWGDDFAPFPKRYPYIKQFGYSKPRKAWK